jgi:hypothetical protein
MICVAAALMIGVCYPVLMVYDYVIDARLHEIGIPQTFAYRTKSMEIEDEADAISASLMSSSSISTGNVIGGSDTGNISMTLSTAGGAGHTTQKPKKKKGFVDRLKHIILNGLVRSGMVTEEPMSPESMALYH